MTNVLRNALVLGAVCAALALGGCQKMAAGGSVDVAKEAEALRQSELAWSKEVAERNVDKQTAHYADDALFTDPANPSVHGKEAIRAATVKMLADPAFTLSFAPDKVTVAKSGEVAYTSGHFTATWTDEQSKKLMKGAGVYVTTYAKGADGQWKVTSDFAHGDSAMPAS